MLYLCHPDSPKREYKTQNTAEIAQLVEHDLAKVGVASSSLVFRSPRPLRDAKAFLFWVKTALQVVVGLVTYEKTLLEYWLLLLENAIFCDQFYVTGKVVANMVLND